MKRDSDLLGKFYFSFNCFLTNFPDPRELQKESDSEVPPSPSLRSASISWSSVKELVAKALFSERAEWQT